MPSAHSVRVFISYAHVDDVLRERLRTHFSALEREGLVQAWDDREILGGDNWADEIDERLNRADVILLLVTADFIRSEYCYGKELERALERNEDTDDRAIVIPIILRKCDWESSKFSHLQTLPRDARAISEWTNEDHYFTDVAKGLRRRIKRVIDADSGWVTRVGQRLRDPRWWQQPVVRPIVLLVLALGAAGAWWWSQAAAKADGEVAAALQAMRTGRYLDATHALDPACKRWLINRQACFTLEKARLGLMLEQPDSLPLEQFAAKVEALKAAAPEDPDLLLFSAELALHESAGDGHPDISRAIQLTGDDFPEAYFYLANLQMLAGRYADALPLLDKALRSMATAPDHYLNMRAYARAQTNDIVGAMHDYEQSAERGSIVSRIELAELLWRSSEFERASDQLQAASTALGSGDAPLPGRNALPWIFELAPGKTVELKQRFEKRCYARWMLQAGLALAVRSAPDLEHGWKDCGPEATRIASVVAASLSRAAKAGMNASGTQRAFEFARQHNLTLAGMGGA